MNKNEVIAKLMGKCWHEWELDPSAKPAWGNHVIRCKHCHTAYEYCIDSEPPPHMLPPDYFTNPADHRELELWLCKEENWSLLDALIHYSFEKDNPKTWGEHWVIFIKDLPSLLFDFLGTEGAQDKFGWEECPNESMDFTSHGMCPVCNGSGRIMKQWLKTLTDTKTRRTNS